MAAKLVVETRKEGEDKWRADASFSDFDTCLAHIKKRDAEGHIVRLIVPGGFELDSEDKAALEELGIAHNH